LSESVGELEEKLKKRKSRARRFLGGRRKRRRLPRSDGKAREAEESLAQLRARHSENALERDRNSREKQYRSEQIANLTERAANLKGEIEATEQRLKLVKSEIKRLEKDSLAERAAAERAELDLREAEGVYERKSKELGEIETKLEAERESVLRHTAAFERLTEIARQLENTDERLQERFEGLRREGERAAEIFAEHRRANEKLEKTLTKEREKLENLHREKQQILEESKKARNDLDAAEKISNDWREEFFKKRNRVETLRELEERKTIYAPAVQKLFAEQKRIGVNFLGVLADKLNVDERAEKAVENLFGGYLQTILVASEDDARRTIRFTNENNLGRISILVCNFKSKVQSPKSKIQNEIANFIGVSDEFAGLWQKVFARNGGAPWLMILKNRRRKTVKFTSVSAAI
jgi:chromosome segregation protein